jgi:hypothetical protein
MYSLQTLTLLLSLTTALISAESTTLITATRRTTAIPTVTSIPDSRILNISDVWVPTNITSNPPAAIQNVSIVVPPPLDPYGNNTHVYSQSVSDSLPHLLAQLGVDEKEIPALVAEAIPLMKEAVISSLNGSALNSTTSDLHRRNLFGDIGNWIKKVVTTGVHIVETATVDTGCSIFAAGAVPGYLVSADLFRIENIFKSTHPTSLDQDFYIFPLHGPVSHNDHIVVYYSATFPPGFGSADGVTMGRTIYLRAAMAATSTDRGFQVETKTLLHEFTHVKQYQALGYNLPAFGLKYLFEYCKVYLFLPPTPTPTLPPHT